MQLSVTGHHVDVTPPLRAYVTEKMQKITRHFDHVISIDVILNVERHQKDAEASLHAAGKSIHATHSDDDMYAAIDGMVDKLDRQVRRHKQRLRDNHGSRRRAAQNP